MSASLPTLNADVERVGGVGGVAGTAVLAGPTQVRSRDRMRPDHVLQAHDGR